MITGLRAVVLIILLLAAACGARAEDRALVLRPGTASRLVLDAAFATVILGDPHVVDVHTGGDQSVIVEALNPGATNLVFVDARGMVIANIRVSVCDASAFGGCDAAASTGDRGWRSPSSVTAPGPRQDGGT
ncbi:pilus assembly protein N-terminal domain-containing protein [Bradyrhizobium erythrophlei]|uniref:pilus assembly protein N-terminal domain-containing protein n=1 Tax=Bradyrhizobium erythrophlei TaxID=1437360 RepID=UPI0035E715BD